jgi:crotonobetainyl-CoA:carnitine CoA-transferase CaiB-like acyl-CoA transferase
MSSRSPLPLQGLLVIDLTQVVAGPYATMLLGDAGADIIKIERPGSGDPIRSLPPFRSSSDGRKIGGGILRMGRNKRSVALDIAKPAGKEVLLELVRKADILWENFVPGTMEKLGLGYEFLQTVNPRLIYATISGFGREGSEERDRAALDLVAQAESGLMDVTGDPGSPPAMIGAVVGDLVAALYATIGTLNAVLLRNHTGKGTVVDVAMADALFALNERAVLAHLLTGDTITRGRLGHAGPYARFDAKDGSVVIAASIPSLYTRLCTAIGREDLLALAPAPDEAGVWHRFGDVLRPVLEEWVGSRTRDDVLATLRKHSVPAAPVLTVAEAARSKHYQARHMLIDGEHPIAGRFQMVGSPIKIAGVPEPVVRWTPDRGQHTDEVLRELLGYDDARLAELREQKVIG